MLYQYINQGGRKLLTIGIILGLVVVCIFLFNYNKISEQNFYYYLFSTIVQGFLALIGVLSAAVVYKLQLIENDLNSVRDKAIPAISLSIGSIAEAYSWAEAQTEMKKILLVRSDREEFRGFLKKIDEFSKQKGEVRNSMVDFFIVASFDVLIALVGIPLSTIIISNEWHLFGVIYAMINILVSTVLLVNAIRVARKIFGYSFYMSL